ncbi:N-acetyltransferase [Candidatus Woesearchaeota archaeon]|nr:N-acetyltransferase [Candidatus Woesearchaeota archaeon]
MNLIKGNNVTLGLNVVIGNNVVIYDDVVIGDNVRIDDNVVLGKLPMKSINSAVTTLKPLPPLEIGSNCIVGSGAIIYRGSKIKDGCLVADLATIRENVLIGEKTIVGRGVAIENECSVGSKCKLETNAYITAYSIIEDGVFVAPNVSTSNDNFVGRTKDRFKHFKGVVARRGSRIGVGAIILPGIELGEDCLVAAGSLVTKNVPAKKIVMGVPAIIFRDVPDEQLLKNQ